MVEGKREREAERKRSKAEKRRKGVRVEKVDFLLSASYASLVALDDSSWATMCSHSSGNREQRVSERVRE